MKINAGILNEWSLPQPEDGEVGINLFIFQGTFWKRALSLTVGLFGYSFTVTFHAYTPRDEQ